MATHSSILAWEIEWTEEPSGLHSTGVAKSWTWLSDWAYKSLQGEPIKGAYTYKFIDHKMQLWGRLQATVWKNEAKITLKNVRSSEQYQWHGITAAKKWKDINTHNEYNGYTIKIKLFYFSLMYPGIIFFF